jgi:arylsulfatase A-like enzyme
MIILPRQARDKHRKTQKKTTVFSDNLTEVLRGHGMWDDTIFVVANDNGGPVCIGGGRGQAAGDGGACGADIGYRGDIAGGGGGGGGGVASNWPLRGAKHSVWEGGVRGNSFVAGGALHPDLSGRGNIYEGLMHLMDWHAIFLRLSGFHDHVVRERNTLRSGSFHKIF